MLEGGTGVSGATKHSTMIGQRKRAKMVDCKLDSSGLLEVLQGALPCGDRRGTSRRSCSGNCSERLGSTVLSGVRTVGNLTKDITYSAGSEKHTRAVTVGQGKS